jgi:hypothetical protein
VLPPGQEEIVFVGRSRYDPDALLATKKHRERRRKRLAFMRLAMQTIAVTNATFEVLDNIDYDDSDH